MSQEPLFPEMKKALHSDALISECGKYRYWLSRFWDEQLPVACWIMLNPSTADADQDDPTIRRCMGFARSWGCGGIYVVNLFALRATDPKILRIADDPVGPDNDWAIKLNATTVSHPDHTGPVVAAWGIHGIFRYRDKTVRKALEGLGIKLQCLGLTSAKQPRHPLYVAADTKLIPLEDS